MRNFKRERLSHDLIWEIAPLLEEHWREIAHYLDIGLHVDWERYKKLDESGALHLYTVRDGLQGALIGYAAFIVGPNLHYRDSVQATQDVLFLDPMVRGAMLGSRFVAWCDRQLRDAGVQVVYHHSKDAHDYGPLLERLGYERIETIWGRRLDHGNHSGDHGRGALAGRSADRGESSTAGGEEHQDSGNRTEAREGEAAYAGTATEQGGSGSSTKLDDPDQSDGR